MWVLIVLFHMNYFCTHMNRLNAWNIFLTLHYTILILIPRNTTFTFVAASCVRGCQLGVPKNPVPSIMSPSNSWVNRLQFPVVNCKAREKDLILFKCVWWCNQRLKDAISSFAAHILTWLDFSPKQKHSLCMKIVFSRKQSQVHILHLWIVKIKEIWTGMWRSTSVCKEASNSERKSPQKQGYHKNFSPQTLKIEILCLYFGFITVLIFTEFVNAVR